MCDSDADPPLVGCRVQQGKLSDILNSSTSVSDLSEAASDMSLSTSPGSDIPSQMHKDFIPQSPESVSINAQQPRKRVVVRQLSSNPYLTSSEMSPSDNHPVIVGSHSFASGDSRLYANGGSFPDNCLSELLSKEISQKANSYPLTSTCFWESDEEEDDNGNDEVKNSKHVFLDNSFKKSNGDSIIDKVSQFPIHRYGTDAVLLPVKTQREKSQLWDSTTTFNSRPEVNPPKHYIQDQNLELHEQQFLCHQSHHHFHHQFQQQHDKQSHSNIQPENVEEILHETNKINGFKRLNNQNELHSDNDTAQLYFDHQQDITSSSPPKSREINSWGHFYKPSAESHYKYRRSHYSSDSEEEEISSNKTEHAKESSTKVSLCKTHKLPCKCNLQDKSDSQVFMYNNNANSKQVRGMDQKSMSQNGMKPHEFKERFQLIKKWFSECNDGQKNIVLKGLLHMCELPQLHLLSVHMSKELHHGCPSNCEDIITWLPPALATKVISYLDPVSLCHAAQVCKVWRQLAEDQSLWRRFCCETKWRLSKAAEHKQVISHMSPEGSIQWKNVFAERFRLRNNWLKGRCTVRTFEGHLQGISCVQFDDSRIVSGSSDKTIKVWNMRTNAPWSVQTLMGHHGTVRCLHLEGNRLVSGSCDKTIKVWDLSTQESWSSIACKVTMTGHTDTVRCLQADDDKVISGSYDKTLKIWDLKSGKLRTTLRGHQASVLCVHFSETKIVSGSADKTINVWNYEGRCMMTLRGHQDAVTCLMFDSTRIVSGSLDHNLKFWDIHTGKCLNTIDWKEAEGHTDVIRCLQADSWRVVSAADDKTIKVWNLATGERLVTLRNHTDGVTCLQFNDFIIVSGSYDKSVKLWDFSCC